MTGLAALLERLLQLSSQNGEEMAGRNDRDAFEPGGKVAYIAGDHVVCTRLQSALEDFVIVRIARNLKPLLWPYQESDLADRLQGLRDLLRA